MARSPLTFEIILVVLTFIFLTFIVCTPIIYRFTILWPQTCRENKSAPCEIAPKNVCLEVHSGRACKACTQDSGPDCLAREIERKMQGLGQNN